MKRSKNNLKFLFLIIKHFNYDVVVLGFEHIRASPAVSKKKKHLKPFFFAPKSYFLRFS